MIGQKLNNHLPIFLPKVSTHMNMMKEFREKCELSIIKAERDADDKRGMAFSGHDIQKM